MHAALAATATLVALAFALSTLDRFAARRRRHEGAWTVSLLLFSAGAASLWAGGAVGWDEWTFRSFYLFGAILNVPFLALGTVYLLAGPRTGDRWGAAVALLGAFAAGLVVAGPLTGPIDPDVLPQGSDVLGVGPRLAAALASGVGATVIVVGAVLSAVRLARTGRRPGAASTPPAPGAPSPRRLALANVVIAAGTLVLSASGLLNSVVDEMDAFAVTLAVGITVIFVGFLLTGSAGPAPAGPPPWHPPDRVADALDHGAAVEPDGGPPAPSSEHDRSGDRGEPEPVGAQR